MASFSMAKSYTSALVGAAVADGFIKSVDDPITNYLPELSDNRGFGNIRIKHLLQMTSGIKGSESYYNPVVRPLNFTMGVRCVRMSTS